jgi:HEAT repeat protein
LGRIGPAAKDFVPELAGLLRDPNGNRRGFAALALGRIGPAAKDFVPELAGLLRDPERNVRMYAACALGGIGPAAKDAVPELAGLLSDPEPGIRGDAAYSLGQIGPAAQDVLAEFLKDAVADVRQTAIDALRRIPAEDRSPEVARLLDNLPSIPVAVIRDGTIKTLRQLHP